MSLTRTHKILLSILAGILLLVGGTAYATYQAVAGYGFITVDVTEKSAAGGRVRVMVPGFLVRAGVSALHFIPDHELDEIRHELGEVGPMFEIFAEELEAAPDMTLVRVEDEDEFVLIRKEGGLLVIDVETEDEDVHVSIPISAVSEVLEVLADTDY